MTDEHIPDGPFTQANPSARRCGTTTNHDPHVDRVIEDIWGGKRGMWYSCPGWETTHTVTVTAADGRVIGSQVVDLRELTQPHRYLGTNSPEVRSTTPSSNGRELTTDELTFGVATVFVAPQLCPYDCDRCHEHLLELADELDCARQ